MKRILLLTIVLFSTMSVNAQLISYYKTPLDSLALKIQEISGAKVYYVADASSENLFTFAASESTFLNDVSKALMEAGYVMTSYGGKYYILKGSGISLSLPGNYFAEHPEDGVQVEYMNALTDEEKVVSFANKVYEIGRKENCRGGKVLLKGIVTDVGSGEPVEGITVYSEQYGLYSMTDKYGEYKLMLPAGENDVKLSGLTYDDMTLHTVLYENGTLNVPVKEKVFSLKGAVISSEGSNRRRTELGKEVVHIDRIKHIPSAFGEADVVKALLTLPGVKAVGEASGGFNVRGGAADQNLVLFNDNTIYNSTHLFGMFSAFNPDVVSNVELYKSSIPAEYGGRISSVLEVMGKEGDKNKFKGSAGIGLLTTHLELEGPLSKKTSFVAGGRLTYSDWMLKLLPDGSGYRNGAASFYDVNASVTHKFNDKNSLYAYGYYSKDGFKFNADTTYRYSNLNASIKWRHSINDHHSMSLSAGYDQYLYSTYDTGNSTNAYKFDFGIRQGFAKLGFKVNLSDRHILSYGLNGIFYNLTPGNYSPYGDKSQVNPQSLPTEQAVEAAAYVGDEWSISDRFSADLGVRLAAFNSIAPGSQFYWNPELRVSGKYLASDWLTIKAGFNSMTQFIHLLSNTTSISPTDVWKLSDSDIKPQTGWQAAAGLYSAFMNNTMEFSVEGYYKRLDNYLDYKSGAVLLMQTDLANNVIATRGKAYGVELMLKKLVGSLNGWMSYSYSRTLLQDKSGEGVSAVNRGDWYPAPYDKPHEFKFVGNYKFTHRVNLSLNVDYSTGRPVTIPVSAYTYGNSQRLYYADRNSYRIPDYFRMDASVSIEPGHRLTKLTHFSITFGVYNITGRKNAYSVFFKTENGQVNGYKLCVFGSQIPYINLNLNF